MPFSVSTLANFGLNTIDKTAEISVAVSEDETIHLDRRYLNPKNRIAKQIKLYRKALNFCMI